MYVLSKLSKKRAIVVSYYTLSYGVQLTLIGWLH